jgi:hypothetical protein
LREGELFFLKLGEGEELRERENFKKKLGEGEEE